MAVMRSIMYVPGNNPKMVEKAPSIPADIITLDLEDSVPPSEKEAARKLVAEKLKYAGSGGAQVYVRINNWETEMTNDDLEAVVWEGLDGVTLAKTGHPDDVKRLDWKLEELERRRGIPVGTVKISMLLETAKGIMNAYECCMASSRNVNAIFGAVDYCRDMRVKLTSEAVEQMWGRAKMAIAARAAGIVAIDAPFVAYQDIPAFERNVMEGKQMGYEGRMIIHPSQVEPSNRLYAPDPADVEWANGVVKVFEEEGLAKGKAAVSTTGEGNVSIELNGESTLRSGYEHAGLEKNNGGSLTIADEDKNGKLTAWGGQQGAGIGGGHTGDGSDIIISGGEVSASGGENGAGIGGGVYGKGEGITVSGNAQLKVRGGSVHGDYGTGAGIGGGGSYGTDGAEVEPDICALNPGGKIEYYAPRSSMSGTPNKTVTNPTGDFVWDSGTVTTPATCTGKGVRTYTCTSSSHTKTEDIPALNHSFAGQEYVSDNNATCEQDGTKTAKCVRYGTGGCMETDTVTDTDSKLGHLFEDYVSNNDATYAHDGTKTAKCVRYDQCGETHTMPDEGSRLIAPPLYRVTDKDGRDIAYTAEQKGGVLTVTVDEDLAILTGRLSGIRTLKAQGVEKIVFVTKGVTSAFLLSDLLDKGEGGEAYRLTHSGKAVTFTLGESMADVSAILIKP